MAQQHLIILPCIDLHRDFTFQTQAFLFALSDYSKRMAAIAQSRIPDSPSQLADSLANIRLDDINNGGDESIGVQNDSSTTFTAVDDVNDQAGSSSGNTSNNAASPAVVAENLKRISSGLEAIREQLFVIQEKRHAGIFSAVTEDVGSTSFNESTSTPTKDNKSQREKSLVLDVEMAKLNGLMEDVSNRLETAEKQLQQVDNNARTPTLQRRGSLASLNSISSLDSFDDAFGVETIGLSKKPEVLKKQYAELLNHWDTLQKEAKTLEEELGGDKYLRVFNSIGDQMEEMMDSLDKALASCHDFVFAFNRDNGAQHMEGESENTLSQSTWRTNEERLAALQTVKRSFNVKRTSYGPACEQMFSSLERGVKQHSTRNGTILRRFMELKTRWRSLRERVSKMDKELKRIETQLMEFDANASQDIESLAVATPPRRPLSRLNPSTHSPATQMNRKQSASHDRSPSIGWSPSTSNQVGDLSMSLTHNRSPSASVSYRPSSSLSQRTDDTNISQSRIPRLMSAGKRIIGAASRRSSNVGGEERPSSALSFTSNSSALFGKSPSSSKFRSNPTGPDSSPPVSFTRRREHETNLRSSMQTPEPTIMARVQRMSLFGGGSGTGSNTSRRSSRPPPVRYSANRVAAAAEHQISKSPSSSSLSATATSNAAVSARTSPQQTVKPLNISRRQSSLLNNNNNNGRTTPLSAAALAKVPYAAAHVNGESTPGQYHVMSSSPSSSYVGGGTTYSTGDGASSVSNYRTKRSSMISSQFVSQIPKPPSITSGRETPTYSDGGNSSVWEGTVYGMRPSSRLTAGYGGRYSGAVHRGFDAYKPNPNDAIDVEVARVVNSIGVRIERVDPPLPRGVKELNPSSTTLVRYQVGTKVIVCKLLQLHRPNSTLMKSSYDSDQSTNKAKKVLTRVGGGWIDLEQYLLSRLGTM